MDVSIWWVAVAAAIGMMAGILLFAVLTIAADPEREAYPEEQVPPQPVL